MSYLRTPYVAMGHQQVHRQLKVPSILAGILALAIGILPTDAVQAQTRITDDIVSDTVWSDPVYHVFGTINVPADVTLTIRAGTVLKFAEDGQFVVTGTLRADGTAESRISFTSLADDNIAGDTRDDGPSVGWPGAWRGLYFEPGSTLSILSFCDVWFAGSADEAMVNCRVAAPTLRDCRLRAGTMGVRCLDGASPLLERTAVDGCTGVPIAIDLDSSPIFDDVIFGAEQDNAFDAVGLTGGTTTGNTVIPRLSLTQGATPVDISYLLLSTIVVDSLHTLSFEAGVVVKFMPGTALQVAGYLETPASALERIIFTSVHDDQHGYPRDTSRDGNATSPSANDWEGIVIIDSGRLLIQDTDILYAGTAAIAVGGYAGEATIHRTRLAYSGSGILVGAHSVVTLADCDLNGHLGAPVRYALGASVDWTDLRAVGNGISAIGLLAGTIDSDQVLASRTLGTWDNVSYFLPEGLIDIEPGASLTIEPGVTIKFGDSKAGILVHGHLIANAPVENPIVLTSSHDDCAGSPRDTHGDGWANAPCPADWGSIKFERGDPGSLLNGCIIRFGGGTCNGAVEMTGIDVAVRNSLFEYNLVAIGSDGGALDLVRNKSATSFSNVAFRDNVADSITRIGGTLSKDGVLEAIVDINNLYYLDRDLVIPFGVHLDILPGVDIIAEAAGIDVYGSLNWSGELERTSRIIGPSQWIPGGGGGGGNPGPGVPQITDCDVVFGCDFEDLDPLVCAGGKRNKTAAIEWEGIRFHASSDDTRSVLRDLIVSGAAEPVSFRDSSPLFERVIFDGMADDGIGILGRSAPRFNECIFRNAPGVPLRISLSAAPRFIDPLFSSNGLDGLGLVSQSFSDAMRLDLDLVAGTGLSSYIALGDLHIAPGQTLTIGPGVVLKFTAGASLLVDGQLRIEGVNDFGGLVALTSVSDDYWGGDTNQDGSTTRGRDTTWGGIKCSAIAADATPFLQGCVVANVRQDGIASAIQVAGDTSLDLTEVLMVGNDHHITFNAGGGDPAQGAISMSDFAGDPAVTAIANSYHAHTIAAEDCWWGAASGPHDGSNDTANGGLYNPAGEGTRVTDGVDYDPFSTAGSHVRLRGDASRDGRVTTFDASVVIRHLAGLWPLEAEALLRADADCDGDVDALDASVLLGLAAGSVEWLDCDNAPTQPASGVIGLQYDSYDSQKQEFSLRWDGSRQPQAARMRLLPLQPGIRIIDLRLSTPAGEHVISAAGGNSAAKTFVFAASDELATGTLLYLELELDAGVDLSRALVRIEDLWVDGHDEPSLDIRIDGAISSQPQRTRPLAASPNPFNPSTSIDFVVFGESGQHVPVRLGIYDLSGRLIRTLVHEPLAPGTYQRSWTGLNDAGQRTASGVYVLRLVQGSFVTNEKLTLLK